MIDPAKLDQIRSTELASLKKKALQAGQKTVDDTLIKKSIPDDAKPKGTEKLPYLLYTLGSQIPQIIQPSLQNLIQKYIPDVNVCPNNVLLQELIIQRNNIVQSLNNIGVRIDQTGNSITGLSNFLTVTTSLIGSIDLASIAISAALKIPPVNTLPVPGAIPSLLNDAQTFIRKTTFDKLGTSKLSKLQGTINSSALVISVIGTYILQAKSILDIIDTFVKKCDTNNNLIPISKGINDIANAQLQASQTQNEITYNGFIIEIEEIPFTPTVTRRRAVGKNQTGIVLIQTELSFTTDNQTLINELKLIIDRDNLKAY
jgi:hypothetical protein